MGCADSLALLVKLLWYIQLGGKKNWTLHTNATYVIHLNPYKSLKYAAFGPLYAGGVSNSFYHLTVTTLESYRDND